MARVLYMVTIEVSPESEARWDSWHSEHHVPDLLAQPGFLGARKFRDPDEGKDGWARYLVLYEVESPEALAEYRQRIGWSYYIIGDDASARRLADLGRTGIGEWALHAEWLAGLAAFHWVRHSGALVAT